MTRETKIGLVVAGSFLCLVCVVVASKMNGNGDGAEPQDQPPTSPNVVAAVIEPPQPNGVRQTPSVPAPAQVGTGPSNPAAMPVNAVPPKVKTPEQAQKELEDAIQRQKKEKDKLAFVPSPLVANATFDATPMPTPPGTIPDINMTVPPITGVQGSTPAAGVNVSGPMPPSPNGFGNVGTGLQPPPAVPSQQLDLPRPVPVAAQGGGLNPAKVDPTPVPIDPPMALKDSFSMPKDVPPAALAKEVPTGPGVDPLPPPIVPPAGLPSPSGVNAPSSVPSLPPTGLTPPSSVPSLPPSGLTPPSSAPSLPPAGLSPPNSVPSLPPAGLSPPNSVPSLPPAGLSPPNSVPSLPPAGLTPPSSVPSLPPMNINPSGTAPVPSPLSAPPSLPFTNAPPGQIPSISTAPLPNTPPIQVTSPAAAAPIPTLPAAGLPALPPVRSIEPDVVRVAPGETNFTQLSTRLYQDPKYAAALQAFNRDHSAALADGQALATYQPVLTPNQQVLHPPIGILERDYGKLIGNSAPTAVIPAAAPPAPVRATPVVPSAPPVTNLPAGARVYTVQTAGGERIRDIALRVLGNADRWTDLYRVNPTLQPQFAIPQGTQLQLP